MAGTTHSTRSLRSRYLLLSTVISIVVVVVSLLASLKVNKVTESNAAALQLRDKVTATIGLLRSEIWMAGATLSAMLITPQDDHEGTIDKNLQSAQRYIEELRHIISVENRGLTEPLQALHAHVKQLGDDVYRLMELRKNPNWVYPMLPFINQTLLESNAEFETAAALALDEVAENDGETYATSLYREFDEIKDMWRLMILDFRAVIIRFAGLNRVERIAQERNIDDLKDQMNEKLARLAQQAAAGVLGLQAESSVQIMQYRLDKWYADFQSLKKLRASRIWRADIKFLQDNITPKQDLVVADLATLELNVLGWSSKNVTAVERTANQVNQVLWLLTAIGLSFIFIVYLMIDRSVLSPIARIARAFSGEDGKVERLSLPGNGSGEIQALVTAFNEMRRQIHRRQTALEYQALHDALTNLPNRALLQDRLEHEIHLANRTGGRVAFMLLDLDRFKEINDTLGHTTGDRVLIEIGRRLQEGLRDADTVARLGGDEFAIISAGMDDHSFVACANKVVELVERVIEVDQQNLYVGASVGISIYPEHGEDVASLIRQADIAMYRAKEDNKGFVFFSEDMDTMTVDNISLLGDLRQQLYNDGQQLGLFYQPQINLQDGRVCGIEALLRWQHPLHGFISPEHIVRMSEQTGLIGALTRRVLELALRDFSILQEEGAGFELAINLSAWNLQDPQLPDLIQEQLTRHAIKSSSLCLEITESAVMNDPVRANEVLHELSGMGVQLAIDDYGTGFSSLAYLKTLPVNGLKIDKSFVIDMLGSENDGIIVRSTIDLAHNLGLWVVAEGVEDVAVLHRLRRLRCDTAQGYHIARPMPLTAMRRWLVDYNRNGLLNIISASQ